MAVSKVSEPAVTQWTVRMLQLPTRVESGNDTVFWDHVQSGGLSATRVTHHSATLAAISPPPPTAVVAVDATTTVGNTTAVDTTTTVGNTTAVDKTTTVGNTTTVDTTTTVGDTTAVDTTTTVGNTTAVDTTTTVGKTTAAAAAATTTATAITTTTATTDTIKYQRCLFVFADGFVGLRTRRDLSTPVKCSLLCFVSPYRTGSTRLNLLATIRDMQSFLLGFAFTSLLSTAVAHWTRKCSLAIVLCHETD